MTPNERFAFQQLTLDTKIFQIDDVRKNFDFERLFAVITEGFQVEKKNKDKFTIPFADSPKILLTTNYVVGGQGSSFARRREEFELSNYYNAEFTPNMKYKQYFFEDWDGGQWNMFYNLMIYATQFYLKNGIVRSNPINLEYKRLESKVGKEIIEFIEAEIKVGVEYDKNKLYSRYQDQHYHAAFNHQRSFTACLQEYADVKGLKIDQRHSGHTNYFMFTKPS